MFSHVNEQINLFEPSFLRLVMKHLIHSRNIRAACELQSLLFSCLVIWGKLYWWQNCACCALFLYNLLETQMF